MTSSAGFEELTGKADIFPRFRRTGYPRTQILARTEWKVDTLEGKEAHHSDYHCHIQLPLYILHYGSHKQENSGISWSLSQCLRIPAGKRNFSSYKSGLNRGTGYTLLGLAFYNGIVSTSPQYYTI
jgi:hypothetical protein